MCGIIGLVQEKVIDSDTKDRFSNALEMIRHRGPDGDGIYIDKKIALGHVRLSIIDISPRAVQPMISLNERYVITVRYIIIKKSQPNII
jgi:asparagine synthase (glutamine-hydrolysing)